MGAVFFCQSFTEAKQFAFNMLCRIFTLVINGAI